MAKLIIWIVENSGESMKDWLKYAVNKVFQHDGYQSSPSLVTHFST